MGLTMSEEHAVLFVRTFEAMYQQLSGNGGHAISDIDPLCEFYLRDTEQLRSTLAAERYHADRLARRLRYLEWSGGEYVDACPDCGAEKAWPQGHEPDCELAAALAAHAARRKEASSE